MGKRKKKTAAWSEAAKKRMKAYCIKIKEEISGYESNRLIAYIGFPSTPEATAVRKLMDKVRISLRQPKQKRKM